MPETNLEAYLQDAINAYGEVINLERGTTVNAQNLGNKIREIPSLLPPSGLVVKEQEIGKNQTFTFPKNVYIQGAYIPDGVDLLYNNVKIGHRQGNHFSVIPAFTQAPSNIQIYNNVTPNGIEVLTTPISNKVTSNNNWCIIYYVEVE